MRSATGKPSFPRCVPKKTRGAHRQYSRRDVELAMLIRQLLHDEGYTIPGARKRIRDLGRHQRSSPPEPRAQREVALRAELLGLRQQLSELLDELTEAHSQPVHAAAAAGDGPQSGPGYSQPRSRGLSRPFLARGLFSGFSSAVLSARFWFAFRTS